MVNRHDINRGLDAARETERRLAEYSRAHPPAWGDKRWRALRDEAAATRRELAFLVQVLLVELKVGLPDAVDAAFSFLERDPYYFRSGYARRRVAQHLARVSLGAPEGERARHYVLAVIDGRLHCHQPAVGRLAGSVADNALRRELRVRLHVAEHGVAVRALQTLTHVASPGLTTADVSAARGMALETAMLGNNNADTRRIVRWLWAPDWRADIQAKAKGTGPEARAARAILGHIRR